MNDFFASQRLSAYIDGELSPAEVAELETALERSPELRQEYEQLLAAVQFMRDEGPVDAPAGFHARVMERAADQPMPGGLWQRLRRFFAELPMETVAVAVAAAVVLVVVGGNWTQTEAPPEQPAASEKRQLATRGEQKKEEAQPLPESGDTKKADAAAKGAETKGAETKPAEPELTGTDAAFNEMARIFPGAEEPKTSKEPQKRATPAPEDGVVTLDPSLAPETEPMVGSKGALSVPTQDIQEGSVDSALAMAMAYRLDTSDPAAVRSLLMLVQRYGGTAVDANTGRMLSVEELSDSARVPVNVTLPQENLTAFVKALGGIGSTQAVAHKSDQLYAGGMIGVHVDLAYSP